MTAFSNTSSLRPRLRCGGAVGVQYLLTLLVTLAGCSATEVPKQSAGLPGDRQALTYWSFAVPAGWWHRSGDVVATLTTTDPRVKSSDLGEMCSITVGELPKSLAAAGATADTQETFAWRIVTRGLPIEQVIREPAAEVSLDGGVKALARTGRYEFNSRGTRFPMRFAWTFVTATDDRNALTIFAQWLDTLDHCEPTYRSVQQSVTINAAR